MDEKNIEILSNFSTEREEFNSSFWNSQALNTIPNISVKNKISPFEVENLNRIYNIERFPDKPRREAKILLKYNTTTNALIVCGQKLVAESNFRMGEANRVSKRMSKIIDIPVSSIKTKIFQLNSYIKSGEDKYISIGLIKAHKKFINVSGYDLVRVLENHNSYLSIEKALDELVMRNLSSSIF